MLGRQRAEEQRKQGQWARVPFLSLSILSRRPVDSCKKLSQSKREAFWLKTVAFARLITTLKKKMASFTDISIVTVLLLFASIATALHLPELGGTEPTVNVSCVAKHCLELSAKCALNRGCRDAVFCSRKCFEDWIDGTKIPHRKNISFKTVPTNAFSRTEKEKLSRTT